MMNLLEKHSMLNNAYVAPAVHDAQAQRRARTLMARFGVSVR
jgi:hypothetical protein